MAILILIPLCCLYFGVRVAAAYLGNRGPLTTFRQAVLYTILFLSLFSAIVVEGLSSMHALGFVGILVSWLALLITLAGLFRRTLHSERASPLFGNAIREFFRQNPFSIVLAVIVLVSVCLAAVYPTNNYDSQTYHMARVAHWIQNRSVADYPTHIIRQLIYPPLAEWMILHLQLLSGGDRFANAVQTFFFVAGILQVSLLVQAFGGNRRHQFVAAIFATLIPMAIIQSNTTQNDVIASFFILAFVYITVRAYRAPGWFNIITSGVALGLAILTKGTAYLFCGLFCLWYLVLAILYLRRRPFTDAVRLITRLIMIPVIALLINIGHYSRNIALTGSPLGKTEGTSNSTHRPKAVAFVALMNVMNHLPMTSEWKKSVKTFALRHGVNVSDPAYSFNPIEGMVEGFSFHEDYAQNFWHVILIVICAVVFAVNRRRYDTGSTLIVAFASTLLAIAVLFCVLFKWQPWSNRLETPLFFLFCVVLGFVIGSATGWIRALCVVPAIFFAFAALTLNPRHPVFPVGESMLRIPYDNFIYSKGMLECKRFLDTTTMKTFGLHLTGDSPDYPYYKMMNESRRGPRLLQHMFIDNESRKYEKPFLPDVILSVEATRTEYHVEGKTYNRVRVLDEHLALFEPANGK